MKNIESKTILSIERKTVHRLTKQHQSQVQGGGYTASTGVGQVTNVAAKQNTNSIKTMFPTII